MFPDVQLFFPEVRRGGEVVTDVAFLGLGEALRAKVRAIVARPPRVGLVPSRNSARDGTWRQVRLHHHVEFGRKAAPRRPDERHVVALSHGIGEVVADAIISPIVRDLARIKRMVDHVAVLSAPVDRDFWRPKRRRGASSPPSGRRSGGRCTDTPPA